MGGLDSLDPCALASREYLRAMSKLAWIAALVSACGGSVAVDGGVDASMPDAGFDAGRDAGPSDAGMDAGSDADIDATIADAGPTLRLVINELQPQGDDFAEIVNDGTTSVSLDGLFVADADGIDEPPLDPTHRTAFPAGIDLAPGERFVIAMNLGAATMEGLLTDPAQCRTASRCIQTSYGLSASGGDSVGILREGGVVIARGDYPGSSAGLLPTQSWCRLPDLSGEFAPCTPTPEAINAAP